MAQDQAYAQPAPRFTWRTLAGLFDEAWHRERRRRHRWVAALVILIAAGVLKAALGGGDGSARPGAVIAGTHRPGSVSVGNRYLPGLVRLTFVPQMLDSPIQVGVTKPFKVQLVDHLNESVVRAGVPVYLTQSSYMGKGPTHSSAIINGKPAGQRVVLAFTNARGIATFLITGTKASVLPTQFNAFLLDKAAGFQYGVTGALAVRFSAHGH
jgi:hypothetical protein